MRRPAARSVSGTGTQYYFVACENPETVPRLEEQITNADDRLAATKWRGHGRTWQCGGDYWDTELDDLVTLTAVVRKSSWCDTLDAEDGTLMLRFIPENFTEFEVDPAHLEQERARGERGPRFLPKYNVPFKLP